MKVIYRNSFYRVSFFIYLHVMLIQVSLLLTRIGRTALRLLSYLWSLVIVVVALVLYAISIYTWGHNMDISYSISKALWEVKGTVFTTFVLAYFIRVTTQEKERHYKLIDRHDVYVLMMKELERELWQLGKCIGVQFADNMDFYTRERYEKMVCILSEEIEAESNYIMGVDIVKQIDEHCRTILQIIDKYKDKAILTSLSRKEKLDTESEIEQLIYTVELILETIDGLTIYRADVLEKYSFVLRDGYSLVELLREPWRKDFSRDQKIRELIYKCEDRSLLNTYFCMYLNIDIE